MLTDLRHRVSTVFGSLVALAITPALIVAAAAGQPARAGRLLAIPARPFAASRPARAATRPVSFVKQVAPILVQSCVGCHDAQKPKSKFVMSTYAGLLKGGRQGQDIVPGKPEDSLLIELIKEGGEPRMPYKQAPLSRQAQDLIERWIKQGAPYDGPTPATDITTLVPGTSAAAQTAPAKYLQPPSITALAFRPDGKELVASGYHELTFWDPAAGTLRRRQGGLAERTYAIVYSPNGQWLATASGTPGRSGAVKLWRVAADGAATLARDLASAPDSMYAVAFSPDGKLLAGGGADRTIHTWEVATGKPLHAVEDHADWVLDLSFSPDGKRLASASRDKTCKVFDVAKGESLATFSGHTEGVYSVSWSPDGKTVASAGADKVVKLWNPNDDAKPIRDIGGNGNVIYKVRWLPGGKALVTCGADKTARLFDASGGQVRVFQGHTDWLYSLAITRDAKTLATGGWDGEVRVWEIGTGKDLKKFFAAPGYTPPHLVAQGK